MFDDGTIETGILETADGQGACSGSNVTVTVMEFMSAVVPWPTDGFGHVNLHYSIVNSGGRLHPYWISDRALEPAQWLPFAAGLKALLLKEGVRCDAGLTTDDVRLLRVPGTFNHKYDPPRVVALLPLPLTKYNFETSLAFLTTVAPAPVVMSANVNQSAMINIANFEGVKPLVVPMANDSLSDGIEKRKEILLDPRPVFQQCAFMRNAFANGGADLVNPLWNLSVLATTFMEKGNDYAHHIFIGHEGYTQDRPSTNGTWL